jgi:hypothetical protein
LSESADLFVSLSNIVTNQGFELRRCGKSVKKPSEINLSLKWNIEAQ